MPVTIDLPPETEARLRAQAAAEGAMLEVYLSELAQNWVCPPTTSKEKTPEQRVAELLDWANSHSHITAVADDSRESIYEGCGE